MESVKSLIGNFGKHYWFDINNNLKLIAYGNDNYSIDNFKSKIKLKECIYTKLLISSSKTIIYNTNIGIYFTKLIIDSNGKLKSKKGKIIWILEDQNNNEINLDLLHKLVKKFNDDKFDCNPFTFTHLNSIN